MNNNRMNRHLLFAPSRDEGHLGKSDGLPGFAPLTRGYAHFLPSGEETGAERPRVIPAIIRRESIRTTLARTGFTRYIGTQE